MIGKRLNIMRLISLLSRLGKDKNATVLVQFTIYIIAIMGMIGLALDGGRFMLLSNSLQELADAAALAGAAQLDGAQDAIIRADNAAQNAATSNPPRWYDKGGDATITTTYYRALDKDVTTTNPQDANYIKVTTAASQIAPSFLRAVDVVTKTSISNNSYVANAVAQGNTSASCAPIQSFICNPNEASETNPGNANNFICPTCKPSVSVGTMFLLVNGWGTGKGSGTGAPGNWGLIQPYAPLSAKNPHDLAPFWAMQAQGNCVTTGPSASPLNVRTGDVAQFAIDGENVRFDIPATDVATADYYAAPIKIDGLSPIGTGSCSKQVTVTGPGFNQDTTDSAYTVCNAPGYSCPLPRDQGMASSNIGTARPDTTVLNAYWQNHHGANWPTVTDPVTNIKSPITRYQAYLQEVAGTGTAGTWKTEGVEPHGPTCVPADKDPSPASRRIINVAVVDCTYWGIKGSSTPLPTTTLVAQFFMTEPATTGTSTGGRIYGELIGVAQAGANSIFHRIVQLVR
jgi:Flp pilus assembly protein TadG